MCKNENVAADDQSNALGNESELCYCVVKLFRDHGAERKLLNDKTLVRKMIDKLNKQTIGTGPHAIGIQNGGHNNPRSRSAYLSNSPPCPSPSATHHCKSTHPTAGTPHVEYSRASPKTQKQYRIVRSFSASGSAKDHGPPKDQRARDNRQSTHGHWHHGESIPSKRSKSIQTEK